jgi:hypothetical protein
MLQTKPNQWSCAITALAMTLRVPVAQLIEELGHDGSKNIFPKLEEPMCRRGFHSQELIHLAWRWGFTVTAFELFPTIAPTSGGEKKVEVIFDGDEDNNWKRFNDTIQITKGILEGAGTHSNHAVAYDHGKIQDPDGWEYPYSPANCTAQNFYPNRALVFIRRM